MTRKRKSLADENHSVNLHATEEHKCSLLGVPFTDTPFRHSTVSVVCFTAKDAKEDAKLRKDRPALSVSLNSAEKPIQRNGGGHDTGEATLRGTLHR
jgi:hypothetical protein